MKRDNISKDRLIEKIYTDIGIPKNFSKKTDPSPNSKCKDSNCRDSIKRY